MDDTDRRLLLVVGEDPRIPEREISKRLGLSRQSVHHRLKAFERMGVFKQMRACVNHPFAVPAAVWGRSEAESIHKALDMLGEGEFVGRAVVAGGNRLYVLGCLRNISELNGYVEFVKKAAVIGDPTVALAHMHAGIMPDWFDGGSRNNERGLSPLDFKIIESLRSDARKPIAQISHDVGASQKTVRRHLNRMRSEGSIDFDTPWDIPRGEEILTVVEIALKNGSDKTDVARRLIARDPLHFFYVRPFSNIPNFLLGLICCSKMSQIRRILNEISQDDDVDSVMPNVVYAERTYKQWF